MIRVYDSLSERAKSVNISKYSRGKITRKTRKIYLKIFTETRALEPRKFLIKSFNMRVIQGHILRR